MKIKKFSYQKQRGQVVLIVLIVSSLILTIGLSLSKRTVIETKINSDEELLKKAFNAAESGIDYYLATGEVGYSAPDTLSKADITINTIGSGTVLSYSGITPKGSTETYWLAGHDADGSINRTTGYFGGEMIEVNMGVGYTGSVKTDFFYYDIGTSKYNVVRDYIDEVSDDTFMVNMITDTTPLLLAIMPISQNAKITLNGDDVFPVQGTEISSRGKAGEVNAEVNRNLTVMSRYMMPAFMLEAITAKIDVSSN